MHPLAFTFLCIFLILIMLGSVVAGAWLIGHEQDTCVQRGGVPVVIKGRLLCLDPTSLKKLA